MSGKKPTCLYCKSSDREMEIDDRFIPRYRKGEKVDVYVCVDKLPCGIGHTERCLATSLETKATTLTVLESIDWSIAYHTRRLDEMRAELAQRGGAA